MCMSVCICCGLLAIQPALVHHSFVNGLSAGGGIKKGLEAAAVLPLPVEQILRPLRSMGASVMHSILSTNRSL